MPDNIITKYSGFIFDLDGTVYRGEELIKGAKEVFERLYKLNKKYLFVTNKTTNSVAEYKAFLNTNGIEVVDSQIITSADTTVKYLNTNHSKSSFFVIGESAFIHHLESTGLTYTENPQKAEIVIVTLDRFLNFNKLEIAARSLENGARFYAANIDDTCPVECGEITDAGSTIAALEKRTHRKLELHFGKPSSFVIDTILSRINLPKDQLLIIGDRMETDIRMGIEAGIDTCHVLTGVRDFNDSLSKVIPTYTINSIYDLMHT